MGSTGHTNGAAALDFTQFHNIINGEKRGTSATRHGVNPSTLEKNAEVPVSTEKDVDDAVAAARAASLKWADVPLEERREAVRAYAAAVKEHEEEFSQLLTREQGKPLAMARSEVDSGEKWLSVQAGVGLPEDVVADTDEERIVTRHTPLGVCVGIVPWNFPVMLACGKISPALVAGNALIVKPSPFTPYTALKLVELAQRFFPAGVLQALSGDDQLGPWLTEHPGVDKVSFTGSSATGRRVMASCSRTLKRVTLELGGNDAAIVFPDVDIADAAPKVTRFALLNSGQICVAIKRVYVHASIYQPFLAAMVDTLKSLKVGDGFDQGVFMGPIQNEMQYEKVKQLLAETAEAKLRLIEGNKHNGPGYFITPTIVDNPPADSSIVMQEPFGPVFPVLSWEDENDVIEKANGTGMGLGASVWSKDVERAGRVANKLKAGSVWVNSHLALRPDAAFGGYGASGIGVEWGPHGLRSYCNTQTVYYRKK